MLARHLPKFLIAVAAGALLWLAFNPVGPDGTPTTTTCQVIAGSPPASCPVVGP
jgi:hypothetical protein